MNVVDALKKLSAFAANRIDWIQGPGGNTSVKHGDNMLIKASGTSLKDVSSENAIVAVHNKNILEPLVQGVLDIADEASIAAFNKTVFNSVISFEGTNANLKPSMETSFHSLFYGYTLHTHNVYANLFLCSNQFEQLESCFSGDEAYSVSLLGDYYTPGTELSWHIWNQFRFEEKMPNVLFLPNHGVIYSHDELDTLLKMHDDVEQKLLGYLQLEANQYPTYEVKEIHEKHYIIQSAFLKSVIADNFFDAIFHELLFPDQAIYIKQEEISFTDTNAKLLIDSNADLIFNTNKKEAIAFTEIMCAYFFMYKHIKEKGWEALTINFDWQKLTNMQSEQYRKNMMGN